VQFLLHSLLKPGTPSCGFRAAMIMRGGMPIKLIGLGNNMVKRWIAIMLTTLCSCGTSHIDEQYASKVVKDALSISGNITAQKLLAVLPVRLFLK